jgi:excisionase family DNA binding protein
MRLLRPGDVAEMLNCSVSQVYALKDAGKVPFCKIGGMVRFRQEDIEKLIGKSLILADTHRIYAPPAPKLKHLSLNPNNHTRRKTRS